MLFLLNKTFKEKIIVLSIFFFIFGWGLSVGIFQFRYLIFLPIFYVALDIFKEKKNYFYIFPLSVLLFLLIHTIITSYSYPKEIIFNEVIYLIATVLISFNLSFYRKIIMENIFTLVIFFLILIIPLIIINGILGYYLYQSDQNLNFSNLVFNCDNSLISYSKFFFKENSHFGMVASSVLMSFLFLKKDLIKKYQYLFLIFVLINIVLFSTTLLVSILLVGLLLIFYFITLKKYKEIKIVLCIMIVPIIFTNLETCNKKITESSTLLVGKLQSELFENRWYSKSKIYRSKSKKENFSENNLRLNPEHTNSTYEDYSGFNASSSVHFYSLLLAFESLKKKPFGYGLNNYEIAFNDNKDRLENYIKIHPYVAIVNSKDGSNNLAKLIVEFGIFSFLLIPIFFRFLYSNKVDSFQKIFIITLTCTQLIRGAGYFNGGFLFAILIMIIIVFEKNNYKYFK